MATAIRSDLQVYNAAKSNGDVAEASKCFTSVFSELFLQGEQNPERQSITLFLVTNQMKDEIRLLVNELKSQFLKLNPISMPATLPIRSTSSAHQHSATNGWKRVCQDGQSNIGNNQSIRNNGNSIESTEAFFYQQLFETLPEAIKKRILDQSIEACDNSLDRCRLMMLAMTIFSDTASQYGSELLRTLIDLSERRDDNDTDKSNGKTVCPQFQPKLAKTSKNAKNSLILDAIPLVLNTASISELDVKAESLIERTLNFYSNHSLETAASEYEYHELHEGLKKDIVCRILGTARVSALDDVTEERLNKTLSLLNQKYIETISDEKTRSKLRVLKERLIDKPISKVQFHEVLHLICDLKLEIDISDDILFKTGDDDSSQTSQSAPTPPPKSRGRPRKVQQPTVIVSPDDTVRKVMQAKTHETKVVFYLLVQYLFRRCAMYLKQTKTRILTNLANPIANTIEAQLNKGCSQRTSRSKASSQQQTNVKTIVQAPKERRLPQNPIDGIESIVYPENSPLNSKESKSLDSMMVNALIEAQRCMRFLESNHGSITKLWRKFCQDHIDGKLKWYMRVEIDCAIITKDYKTAITAISDLIDLDNQESTTQTRKDIPEPQSTTLSMRLILQNIGCRLQMNDMLAFEAIEDLLSQINTSKLLSQDDSYKCGNIIDEHMVVILHESDLEDIGFIFFDLLSIMRYIVSLLMEYLKRYVASPQGCSDLTIGHTIVLSQFDWPRESETYDKCLSWIRTQKPTSTTPQCLSADTKFTYPDFTRYIRNPSIIEDFMALLNLNYTLDIKVDEEANKMALVEVPATKGGGSQERQSSSSGRGATGGSQRSGKAITTRGVNKTFREDLKVALMAQMRTSTSLVPLSMIADFCAELIDNFFRPKFLN